MKKFAKSVRNQLVQQLTAKAVARLASEIDNAVVANLIDAHSADIQKFVAKIMGK